MNKPTYRITPTTGGYMVSFTDCNAKTHFVAGSRERAERSGRAHVEAHQYAAEQRLLPAKNLAACADLQLQIDALQRRCEKERARSSPEVVARLDKAFGLAEEKIKHEDTPVRQFFSVFNSKGNTR